MGAGVLIPRLLRGEIGLTAAVIVVGCWVAAPAGAQAPAVDVAAVTGQSAPAASVPSVVAGSAPVTTATQASGSVEHAVPGVADAVAETASPPTVDLAIRAVSGAAPPPAAPDAAAAPRHFARPGAHAAVNGSPRATGTKPQRPPRRQARPLGPPTEPVTAMEVGSASRSTVAGSVHPSFDPAPRLDPVSGAVGDSPASGASSGFFFGGAAILLIALLLAAPRLRSRLSGRRAMCWPAAFVPLLERPG
jgi:hypothetical protein